MKIHIFEKILGKKEKLNIATNTVFCICYIFCNIFHVPL